MTPDERHTQAAAYIDRVIAIDRSREELVNMTKKQREQAIEQAVQLFARVTAER